MSESDLAEVKKRRQALVAADALAEHIGDGEYDVALDTLDGLRDAVVAAKEAAQDE